MIVITRSPEETRAFGRRLGALLADGDVILLQGDLGSGKTTLAQGIGEALGIAEVNSPTFVLVAERRGRLVLRHVDLYRLGPVATVDDLGIADTVGVEGVTVVEWPDLCWSAWPPDHLLIQLAGEDDARVLTLRPGGPRARAIVQALEEL